MRLINKLLNWYFSRNALPYWMMIIIDSLILLFSGFFVYWLFHRTLETVEHIYCLNNVKRHPVNSCAAIQPIMLYS